MAIRYKRTQPQAQAFAMAPMVDMVFLLLVFFMCVTAVSGGRARLKIDLPQTVTASAATTADRVNKPQIIISIAEGGSLEVNAIVCQQSELVALLRKLRAQTGAEPSVRVRAHANAPYREIGPVLAACAAAGLSTVSYAAYEVGTNTHQLSTVGAASRQEDADQ